MLEVLDNLEDKGIYFAVLISILFIAFSGMFFGITYFVMDVTHTSLQATDCVIENNTLVGSCQELFAFSVYPFLALRSILVWSSFFFIFGLMLSILILGYRSGSSPVMLGVMVSFVAGMTYLGILLSNMYRALLNQATFRTLMLPFTVYNQVMISFPWFIFFIGLFSVILGIVNFQKTSINAPQGDLNY